jgi:hypothetical protein
MLTALTAQRHRSQHNPFSSQRYPIDETSSSGRMERPPIISRSGHLPRGYEVGRFLCK